jgi:hypothetical protein
MTMSKDTMINMGTGTIIPAEPGYKLLLVPNEAVSAYERGDLPDGGVLYRSEPIIAWRIVDDGGPGHPVTPSGASIDGCNGISGGISIGCFSAIVYPDGRVYCHCVGDIEGEFYGADFKNEDHFQAYLRASDKEAFLLAEAA